MARDGKKCPVGTFPSWTDGEESPQSPAYTGSPGSPWTHCQQVSVHTEPEGSAVVRTLSLSDVLQTALGKVKRGRRGKLVTSRKRVAESCCCSAHPWFSHLPDPQPGSHCPAALGCRSTAELRAAFKNINFYKFIIDCVSISLSPSFWIKERKSIYCSLLDTSSMSLLLLLPLRPFSCDLCLSPSSATARPQPSATWAPPLLCCGRPGGFLPHWSRIFIDVNSSLSSIRSVRGLLASQRSRWHVRHPAGSADSIGGKP